PQTWHGPPQTWHGRPQAWHGRPMNARTLRGFNVTPPSRLCRSLRFSAVTHGPRPALGDAARREWIGLTESISPAVIPISRPLRRFAGRRKKNFAGKVWFCLDLG